jgi:hypothetical protein
MSVVKDMQNELASIFGDAQVCGLDQLIEAQWIDSCVPKCGAVPLDVWNARKVKMGGG